MKRNVLLFISLCVVGCVMTYAQQMSGLLQKGKADTQDCKAWVDEQLSEMSLKEKIGQLFIHTVAPLQTQRNKNNIYAAIKEYKVGGLLFSGGQLSDQVLLTNYAQSLAEVPLLITFDGEWAVKTPESEFLNFVALTLLHDVAREHPHHFLEDVILTVFGLFVTNGKTRGRRDERKHGKRARTPKRHSL